MSPTTMDDTPYLNEALLGFSVLVVLTYLVLLLVGPMGDHPYRIVVGTIVLVLVLAVAVVGLRYS